MKLNKTYKRYDENGNFIATITKTQEAFKMSFETMSESCRKNLLNHLAKYRNSWNIGDTIEKTAKSIMTLPSFQSGCFTYLQAQALAEHIHTKKYKGKSIDNN